MTTSGSGAVFFLGTRAHYQVLQQPESRCDAENGNQRPELWTEGETDNAGNLPYCDAQLNVTEEIETDNGLKRRNKRRQSEIALCERDVEMKPALLNNVNDNHSPNPTPARRLPLLALLASLARRRRRLQSRQIQYLHHAETALNGCTYRESCRCLECQSRYFECDESDYDSEESDYIDYTSRYVAKEVPQPVDEEDDDDEVFIDSPPGDNASTEMLLEPSPRSMSLSSDEPEPDMELEVAAGTPVLLNYLLTHPITCSIQ